MPNLEALVFWLESMRKFLVTAQKMKFSIEDFFSKCEETRSYLKKSLMENFIFCAEWVLNAWLQILLEKVTHYCWKSVIIEKV